MVPAFIVLVLISVISHVSPVLTFIGRADASRIRRYLNKTSQGRILTTYLYGQKGETVVKTLSAPRSRTRSSTGRWVKIMGKSPISVAEGKHDFFVIDAPKTTQSQPLLQDDLTSQMELSELDNRRDDESQ